MTVERDIRRTEAPDRMAAYYAEMHSQRRIAQRRLLARRIAAYLAAALIGAALALAIHDAPGRIAATVLDAQHRARW